MIRSKPPPKPGSSSPTQNSSKHLPALISHWTSLTFEPSQIPSLVKNVVSAELEKQYYGVIGLNKLVLQENSESEIEAIVNSGVVPSLISLMKGPFQPEMKEITSFCLERLCLGTTEQVLLLIDNGIIQEFLDVLNNEVSNAEVVRCSLWGLINLSCCESILVRDMILEQNGVEATLKVLENFSSLGLKKEAIIALATFLFRKPVPYFPLIKSAIPWLCDYLETGDLDLILSRILSSLANISSDPKSIKILMEDNIISSLIEHITSSEESVTLSCLQVIINIIIEGKFRDTIEILKEPRLVPELFKVIDHPRKKIRKYCYIILSLFSAGTESNKGSIIGNLDFVEKIIKAVKNEKGSEPKQMAFQCLSNLTRKCSASQITQCLDNGIYECLIDLLDVEDVKIVKEALKRIGCCLRWGKKLALNDENGRNRFLVELENKGGIEKIKGLLENKMYCGQVKKIWEDYFDND